MLKGTAIVPFLTLTVLPAARSTKTGERTQ
jgi:hypothetical protein